MKATQNILNAQAEEAFRKRWDLPENWKEFPTCLNKWEKTKSYYGYKEIEEVEETNDKTFGGGHCLKDI